MSGIGVITSDSQQIRSCLNEANTVFLVFADTTPPSQNPIQPRYDEAIEVAKNNNPAVWRTLWIKQPEQLDAELQKLLWKPDGITQAVVLSLGTGLDREVKKRYGDGELQGPFDILEAYSQG